LRIREAVPADVEPALALMARAFGIAVQSPSVHTLVAGSGTGTLLVAEHGGAIVGTGACAGFGPTGWLGGIVVAEQARGRGLGRELTEAAIAALGPRETVLLIASALGQPLYERLGFVGDGRYRVFMTPADAAPAPAPVAVAGVRPLTPADRAAVLALDAWVTGEDRTLAVDAGLRGAVGIDGADGLAGVALRPPWAARPILARDPAAGAALLAAVLEPGVRFAAPEANTAAVAALLAHGCEERAAVLRMRRGAPVTWRPEALWSVFSLFFG
jgi:predicted N-acetyltransferase YhbS